MAEKTQPSKSNTESFSAEYYAALLAGLIHKLNNIITVLSGHSGLLLLEPNLKGDILQPVQQMSRAAQLLSRYIDEAAIVTRAVPLDPESVGLSELFESLAISSRPFDQETVRWPVESSRGPPEIKGDLRADLPERQRSECKIYGRHCRQPFRVCRDKDSGTTDTALMPP